ncbi:universal stress protein [Sagittula sp. S175]|uniref:universal stress protein n=1 Tax=Sagittula sp. S175 TaxID=3415129 RepID=UPI003C7C366E
MFQKIAIPVDLAHADKLGKALATGADLAKRHGASVTYIGVTGTAPGKTAHSPEEYAAKLADFASAQATEHGIDAMSETVTAHDPAIDLDKLLVETVGKLGADLVVMATHVPNAADYLWAAHGVSIAGHVKASVFLVRDV